MSIAEGGPAEDEPVVGELAEVGPAEGGHSSAEQTVGQLRVGQPRVSQLKVSQLSERAGPIVEPADGVRAEGGQAER